MLRFDTRPIAAFERAWRTLAATRKAGGCFAISHQLGFEWGMRIALGDEEAERIIAEADAALADDEREEPGV